MNKKYKFFYLGMLIFVNLTLLTGCLNPFISKTKNDSHLEKDNSYNRRRNLMRMSADDALIKIMSNAQQQFPKGIIDSISIMANGKYMGRVNVMDPVSKNLYILRYDFKGKKISKEKNPWKQEKQELIKEIEQYKAAFGDGLKKQDIPKVEIYQKEIYKVLDKMSLAKQDFSNFDISFSLEKKNNQKVLHVQASGDIKQKDKLHSSVFIFSGAKLTNVTCPTLILPKISNVEVYDKQVEKSRNQK